MLPIAILQNDESVPLGVLGDSLAARRVPVTLVEVFRGEPLPDLAEVSGVVIKGGRMGAFEEQAFPFLVEEKNLVRNAVDRRVPALGICLGCQIIADAMGGSAYRVEPQEAGVITLQMTEAGRRDRLFRDWSAPTVSWHHDSWDLPPDGTLLAESDQYPQALRVGSAVGVQFHPEVTPRIVGGWIRRDGDSLHEIGIDPAEFMGEVHGSFEAMRVQADRFFQAWIDEVEKPGS